MAIEGASPSRTRTAENDTAVTPTMSSATKRRSMELPADARPRTGMSDRRGAPSSRAHLPGEPFRGVRQRDHQLAGRTAGRDGRHPTCDSQQPPPKPPDGAEPLPAPTPA